MSLSNEEKNRYSRHILLDKIGLAGQEKLKKAKVLVIGAGGLGSPVLLYLAAAGVGTIGIIDFDVIEDSNLQRQVLFSTEDIGKSKAITAKKKLEAQNPYIEIIAYNFPLNNKNAVDLIEKYDIVIDGTDNFNTRYLVNDACVITNTILVYGAIYKFEGQVSVFNYQNGPTYRCLFPEPPKKGSVPSCSEVGVIGILPSIIGSMQANEAIKILLGIGETLSGKLLIFNSLINIQTKVSIVKNVELSNIDIHSKEDIEQFNYEKFCHLNQDESTTKSEVTYNQIPTDALILDIRDHWEQPRLEHSNLLEAPLDDLEDFVNVIPKEGDVYVVCQKGGRSQLAIEFLEKEYDFTNLINVEGGVLG
ncbi:MAG TPA: molybdopterin-synthase adenylyltransferase MoeB [Crocinitomicaceae bacterium]|nr:molybdopterin-synthase adenylyltransferase MoeB [Crocinitomicaceae bacterium]